MSYTTPMQLVDRGHVKHQGAIIVLSGETYQNARTGESYILKIIRGNTILLEEEHGKGQLLMSYEQFERDYVKSRFSGKAK
jgi:hypothetical protein